MVRDLNASCVARVFVQKERFSVWRACRIWVTEHASNALAQCAFTSCAHAPFHVAILRHFRAHKRICVLARDCRRVFTGRVVVPTKSYLELLSLEHPFKRHHHTRCAIQGIVFLIVFSVLCACMDDVGTAFTRRTHTLSRYSVFCRIIVCASCVAVFLFVVLWVIAAVVRIHTTKCARESEACCCCVRLRI